MVADNPICIPLKRPRDLMYRQYVKENKMIMVSTNVTEGRIMATGDGATICISSAAM